jgi:hypothetical protein
VKTRYYIRLAIGAGVLATVAMTATTHLEGSATTDPPVSVVNDSSGLGGAGAFIPPAHTNGVFGAGGPAAAFGGAGAFIPITTAAP